MEERMPAWNPKFHIEPDVHITYARTNGWYEIIGSSVVVAWGRIITSNQPTLDFMNPMEGIEGHLVKINLPMPSWYTVGPDDIGYGVTIGWIEGFNINTTQGIIGWIGSHGDEYIHLSKVTNDPEPSQRWTTKDVRLWVDFTAVYRGIPRID
jgi:hypothetical protein